MKIAAESGEREEGREGWRVKMNRIVDSRSSKVDATVRMKEVNCWKRCGLPWS